MIIRNYFHQKFSFLQGLSEASKQSKMGRKVCKTVFFPQKIFFSGNQSEFIYFSPGFKKSTRHTKSAVISRYNNFFYRTLNQHPTRSIRGYEKSYSWSASFPKCKFFFEFFFKPLSYVYRVSVPWLNPPGRAPW